MRWIPRVARGKFIADVLCKFQQELWKIDDTIRVEMNFGSCENCARRALTTSGFESIHSVILSWNMFFTDIEAHNIVHQLHAGDVEIMIQWKIFAAPDHQVTSESVNVLNEMLRVCAIKAGASIDTVPEYEEFIDGESMQTYYMYIDVEDIAGDDIDDLDTLVCRHTYEDDAMTQDEEQGYSDGCPEDDEDRLDNN